MRCRKLEQSFSGQEEKSNIHVYSFIHLSVYQLCLAHLAFRNLRTLPAEQEFRRRLTEQCPVRNKKPRQQFRSSFK